ncbi:hypothetical protein [Rhodococcus globerulus]|uniref:hypothetical protein n=1 Tax=Rhodococcus globerulus TaxID=33008 RepID=UPI001C58C6B6|nr:hypothetical protein [Rhodococcus globerulus]QXW00778.1 hypothetical protein KYT97_20595 [Rhodococcus globerulus]
MSKNIRRAGTVATFVGAAALIAPAFAGALPTGSLGSIDDVPAAGFACSAISTETTVNGWGIPFDDEKNQVAAYTADNVFDDDGALELSVHGPTDRSVSYHSAASLPLADVIAKEIGFSERADVAKASFQLRLGGTTGGKFTDTTGFTTLVWVPNPALSATDGVVHANIQDGLWWSTQNIDGAKDYALVTLDAISAAQPNAVVEHYGVSIGTGSAETSTLVDAVKFNGCTTNFAKNDPDTDTNSGSLGNIFGS